MNIGSIECRYNVDQHPPTNKGTISFLVELGVRRQLSDSYPTNRRVKVSNQVSFLAAYTASDSWETPLRYDASLGALM
jgi:hypothetical protein